MQVYENDSNVVDAAGRPPHSVEVVVDGGSNTDIAAQILATKSGGINTYGNITVEVPGEDDDTVESTSTVRYISTSGSRWR